MDTLPLPPRPDVEQYKKRAKKLFAAAESKDDGAVRTWATEWLETIARLRGVTITPFVQGSFDRAVAAIEKRVREKTAAARASGARFTLADAQFLIAQAHGFENWAEFANYVQQVPRKDGQEFEAAVDAVVGGDLPTLESLVRRNPELIRVRSARVHRATLLHYVAANGVEDFRQKTPQNAVAIARFLLESGAEVDALANTYGGGNAQTTMNLLVSSAHPAAAGVQGQLAETLLDFAAAIGGLEDDGSPLMTALAFGYATPAEALAKRGARIDNVVAAAALGRTDLVRSLVVDRATLNSPVPRFGARWLRLPTDPRAHIELALVWACKFGRTEVAELLLELGVDPVAKDNDSMTALHWAAAMGHVDVVKLLLRYGAPLEVKNTWDGTVLDSTMHFAVFQPVRGVNYLQVIEALIAAGADVSVLQPYPRENKFVDEVLRRL